MVVYSRPKLHTHVKSQKYKTNQKDNLWEGKRSCTRKGATSSKHFANTHEIKEKFLNA
jgi:hypothetical protein